MRLKNSIKRSLGSSPDGRRRWAINAFIGAVQMSKDGDNWQDIKPQIVKKNDIWQIDNAPYEVEISNEGGRKIYISRGDKSRYINILANPLIKKYLPNRQLRWNPAKIDGVPIRNEVVMPTPWGGISFIFGNTRIQFQVLFNKVPQALEWEGKKDTITFDIDSSLDIAKLLKSISGIGIPRPKLIDADFNVRRGKWSYKNGQLELGLDTKGLRLPVLLQNTSVEVDTDAQAEDAWEDLYNNAVDIDDINLYLYAYNGTPTGTVQSLANGQLWDLGDTIPSGSTIDASKFSCVPYHASYDDVACDIHMELGAAPSNFTTGNSDISGRSMTTASASWTADSLGTGSYVDSPSLNSPMQEVTDSYSSTRVAVICMPHSNATKQLRYWSYDHGSNEPRLYVEWTEAAGTTATPPTLNLIISEKQSTLDFSQSTSTTDLKIGEQILYYDRGQYAQTLSLNISRKTPFYNRGQNTQRLILKLSLQIPDVTTTGDVTKTPATLALITSLLAGNLRRDLNIPTLDLKIIPQNPSLQRGIIISTVDLKTSFSPAYLQRSALMQILRLELGLDTPDILRDYLYTITKLGLGLDLQIPVVTAGGVPTIATPSTLLLMLEMFSPEIFSGVFPISVTGRYGVEPSVSWEGILTASGRYGSG